MSRPDNVQLAKAAWEEVALDTSAFLGQLERLRSLTVEATDPWESEYGREVLESLVEKTRKLRAFLVEANGHMTDR